jgi:hypothetical protein
MSLTLDQQHLRCDGAGHDGDGCDATALAPIGLRQRLARTAGTSDPIGSPRDWLFVSSRRQRRAGAPLLPPLRGSLPDHGRSSDALAAAARRPAAAL